MKTSKQQSSARKRIMARKTRNVVFPFPKVPRELILSGSYAQVHDVTFDQVLVELKYNDQTMTRNNAGSPGASWRYRMNSVYDPDPFLSSGSVSGFGEWSAFYNTYRVVGFGYEIGVSNNENFGMQFLVCPTQTDLGANSAYIAEFGEVRYGHQLELSAKGGQDRGSLRGYVNIQDFAGPSALFDPAFNSSVVGNPSLVMFLNLGIYTGTNNLVNGCSITVRLTYHVLLYHRVNVFS